MPRLDGFLPSESLLSLVSIRLPEGIKVIWYLKTRERLLSLVTARLASSKADNKRWPPMQPGSAPRLTSEYSHKLNSKKFYITLPTLPTALHLPLKIVSGYASYGGHVRAVTNTGALFEPRLVMTVSTDVGHKHHRLGRRIDARSCSYMQVYPLVISSGLGRYISAQHSFRCMRTFSATPRITSAATMWGR